MPKERSFHQVEYVADLDVRANDDRELRRLLASSFNPVAARIFAERRYFQEPPTHRWLVRRRGSIVSHAACHDKCVGTTHGELHIAGVSEVVTDEAFRRQGMAEAVLLALHAWAKENGFDGAMLFGENQVYSKLGYGAFEREVRYLDHRDQAYKVASLSVRYLPLGARPLPEGLIDIRCPLF